MNLLVDTHAFLWFVLMDAKLSATARALIANPSNIIWFSPASYWEIAVKISKSKYTLPEVYDVFMMREIQQNHFRILSIQVAHTAVVAALPFHHKDPFDRLLVGQCLAEKIALISADPIFDAYGVTRLW